MPVPVLPCVCAHTYALRGRASIRGQAGKPQLAAQMGSQVLTPRGPARAHGPERHRGLVAGSAATAQQPRHRPQQRTVASLGGRGRREAQ